MKVAIIHDYIKEYGGAERVLEALHEIWPEAPVFTSVYLPKFLGPHQDRFKNWDIRTSFLQKMPLVEKLISPIRILTPYIFENFDFFDFDLVVVSATGAYFPNLINTRADAIHVCYCHTPPRYLYGYKTARDWQKYFFGRIIGGVANHWLRQVDFIAAQRPDFFIANSVEVQGRIKKFYKREAKVIYPPVELASGIRYQALKNRRKGYYLAGGRLARAKRIDLALKACNRLKLPLKVFGKAFADYGQKLKNIAGPTIEFLGEVTDEQLASLYQGAKALIYPSQDEDFGIIAVEAQSFGIPVIGLNKGGVKETVIDGKTGILFDEPTVENLIKAIKRLSYQTIKGEDCIENAKRFSKERFKKEIRNFISEKIKVKSEKPQLKT